MLPRCCRARLIAFSTVSCCAREEPCSGKSLTMVAVGLLLSEPPPCSPPPLPPHPATTNAAVTPSTASIPTRPCPILLPPFLDHHSASRTACLCPDHPQTGGLWNFV